MDDGNVEHPKHYTFGMLECIDAMEAMLEDGFQAFLRGQILKYLWRMGKKGDALTDAKKARWYLERLIEQLELEKRTDGDR